MAESLKSKTVKGVAWNSLDQIGNLGLSFVIGVILARILSPSDFGLIAIILVFNAIAMVFLDSGFGNALIRKPDLTENDNSTAFRFNVVAGVVLCALMWVASPFVAKFYQKPILSSLLQVESFLLIINAFKIVQNTQLVRALNFKARTLINVSSHIAAGVIAIAAAYKGFGVWSLVVQHLAAALISLMLLWIVSPWRPRGQWDKKSFRYLWGYGSKLLVSGLIDTIYKNIYPIIIGKLFSPADLGQYTRAKQYAQLPSVGLTNVLQQVTFPVLCKIQHDNERLGDSYRRVLRVAAFIVFPIMIGIAALAHPLVVALVTDKWVQCVPYLQIICIASMWYPIHAINLNLLQVKGRSDLFLRLEVIKKAIITVAIIVSVPFGIIGICVGSVCTSIICLAINTYYTSKLIGVGFLMQMRDLTPTLLVSLTTGGIIYFLVQFFDSDWVKLLVGIVVGSAVFLTFAWLFRMPELKEGINIIKKRKSE